MPACGQCKKEFAAEQALAQHARAVHGSAAPVPSRSLARTVSRGRGRLLWLLLGLAALLLAALALGKESLLR